MGPAIGISDDESVLRNDSLQEHTDMIPRFSSLSFFSIVHFPRLDSHSLTLCSLCSVSGVEGLASLCSVSRVV